jgi:hypothetical protein
VRALTFAVAAVAIAGAIGLVWWALPGNERVLPPGAPVPVDAPETTSPSTSTPVERTPAVMGRGSIAGHVRDARGQAIAGATVRLVVNEPVAGMPSARSDAAGHFQLLGLPIDRVAVLAEAPGYCPSQLGDLDLEAAPDHHLVIDNLALDLAIPYRGQVRSLGRGLEGVSLRLAAGLRDPTAGQPLVQRAETDAEGWFLFDSAPPPPCTLVVERAAGHRQHPPLQVASAAEPLFLDLVPIPRLHGRVLDSQTGAPLPQARIRVIPIREALVGPLTQGPETDFDPTVGTAPWADGSFLVELEDSPQFALAVTERSHCATVLGPFSTDSPPAEQMVLMTRGVRTQGRITWRGDPIGGFAVLFAADGSGPPIAVALFGFDGELQMPPAPPGNWLLQVTPNHGARLEQALTLALPGPKVVNLVIADGTRLTGTVRGAAAEDPLEILCQHSSGLLLRTFVRDDGTFAVDYLCPGQWRAYAAPRTWNGSRHSFVPLLELLDDPGFVVDQSPALQRDLIPANQLLATLAGRAPANSTNSVVELIPSNATQRQVPHQLLWAMVDTGGMFRLPHVLPGEWLVQWTPPGKPAQTKTITAIAGQAVTVDFLD